MQIEDDHKYYQKSVLDIDVRINTPYYLANRSRNYPRQKTPKNGDNGKIQRHSLLIRRSQISVNLETEIKERERELYEFKTNNQNALLSPLLTQALVNRTEKHLEQIAAERHDEDNTTKPFRKFRRYARIVRTLCLICRRWRRYDLSLASKFADSVANRQTKSQQDACKEVVPFDCSHFKSYSSKISDEEKQLFRKLPRRRTENDLRNISTALRKHKFFQIFSEECQSLVTKFVGYEYYDPGRVICLQHRSNDRFYFLLSGLITKVVTLNLAEGIAKRYFCELHQGTSSDIYETLNGRKRNCSYICKTHVEIILVEREDLYNVFQDLEIKGRLKSIIKSIELFQTYPQRLLFHKKIVSVKFFPHKAIVDCTTKYSPYFYIIKTGSCKLYMNLKDVFRLSDIGHRQKKKRNFHKALQMLPQLEHRFQQDQRYVHVNTIHAGEIYGIETLLPRVRSSVHANVCNNTFNKTTETEKFEVVLVSDGAECLLIDKKKFLKYADFCTISKIFSNGQCTMTIPNVERLNYALRWSVYKESVVDSIIIEK